MTIEDVQNTTGISPQADLLNNWFNYNLYLNNLFITLSALTSGSLAKS